MTFSEFEDRASRDWHRIPDEFKVGIDGLVVRRDARAHARSQGVYTLGECITDSYPSDFGGPDTIRSEIVLYYGSFRRLAAADPDYDWGGEIWETLTHELKHHLESLADEDDLGAVDAAMEDNFRRLDGQPFDPGFYRDGVDLGDGWFELEGTFCFETIVPRGRRFCFEWNGDRYSIELPDDDADVLFVTVEGVSDAPDELIVVSLRPRPLWSRLHALLKRERQRVSATTVSASRQS